MTSFRPAERAGVGLLIGIAGPTGSGKTLSALRLARGLAGGDDAKIAFIDTEAGRALHYAPRAGEAPSAFTFAFAHAELTAPFTPEAYLEKIAEAEREGFAVIVIDSFSHVWAGEGGLQDMHDANVDAAVERARKRADENKWRFDEDQAADKASVGAWKEPKLRHKRMVSRLLQSRAHLVICMRAEDKLRMETKEEQGRNGKTYTKTEITPAAKLPPAERWQPICEKRFPYELITSLVLTPEAPGVPVPLKLQSQHRAAVLNNGDPLDESVGQALAAWAAGATPAGPRPAVSKPAAPSQAASGFPGDLVTWRGSQFDPNKPQRLPSGDEMSRDEWSAWANTLCALIDGTPSPALKLNWFAANADDLNDIAEVMPELRARAEAHLPRPSSAPPTSGAERGASSSDGHSPGGEDAPHLSQQGSA